MESQLKIPTDTEWDELRSLDLCYNRVADIPLSFGQDVLREIAPLVKRLDVERLAGYLRRRGAISDGQCGRLIERSYTREDKCLELQRTLNSAIWDEDPSLFVKDFYLALCDLYEDDGQKSHYQFAQFLREKCLASLKPGAHDGPMKELTYVLGNVPSVTLSEEQACQLRHSLGLAESVDQGNLRDIVVEWHEQCHNPTSKDVVKALMTTPGLGRYVSGLVPYCLANCPKVHSYIGNLKEEWQLLAEYMGYSQQEVHEIQRSDATDKQFLRVWRMPNCDGAEDAILEETVQLLPQRAMNEMAVSNQYKRTSSGTEQAIQSISQVFQVNNYIQLGSGQQPHAGSALAGTFPAHPEVVVQQAMRQLSMQGSPQPMHTDEHPLLKVSDGSLASQVSDDGTYSPATTQAATQVGQPLGHVSTHQPPHPVPSTVSEAHPLGHVLTNQLAHPVPSTVGGAGHLSTNQPTHPVPSAVSGARLLGHVLTNQLEHPVHSTVSGAHSLGHVSTNQPAHPVPSTVGGARPLGHVSMNQPAHPVPSTVGGAQPLDHVLTSQPTHPVPSTVGGARPLDHVSTTQPAHPVPSTVGGARPLDHVSTTQPAHPVPSTVSGAHPSGHVSTHQSAHPVPSTVGGAQPLGHVSTTPSVYSPLPEASGGRQSPSEHVSSHAVMSKKDIAPGYGCYCGKVAEDHNICRADVNTRDENGMTGLMHACVNKHTQCVSSLLELDADVNLQDKDEMTALMHACERRASKCVELLLNHNDRADTELIDKDEMTALEHACKRRASKCVELLLDHRADTGPIDKMYERTPLHEAIMLCSDEAVKLLLQHGARQVTRDQNSISTLELALELKVSPEKKEAKRRIVEYLVLSLEGRRLQ